jgi:hypothetical protein
VRGRNPAQLLPGIPAQIQTHEGQVAVPQQQIGATQRIGGFLGRPVGDLLLRGCAQPVAAFEPLTADRVASPPAGAAGRLVDLR